MSKTRRWVAALGVAILIASTWDLSLASATASSANAPATIEEMASGLVRNDGKPVAGADVELIAWPSQAVLEDLPTGVPVPLRVVGTTTTDDKGHFSIEVEPEALPRVSKGPKSRVDLEMRVTDGARQLSYDYTVEAVPEAQRAARGRSWTALSGSMAPGKKTAPELRVDLGRGTAWDVANDPAKWLKKNGVPYGRAGRNKAARVAVKKVTPAMRAAYSRREICLVIADDVVKNLPEHFLNVYAWSGARGTVTQSNGVDHSLGIGIRNGNTGAWKGSGSSTISLNSQGSQSRIVNSSVWNRVNYRDYIDQCAQDTKRRPLSYYDMLSNDWAPVAHVKFTASCSIKLDGATWSTGSAKNKTYGAGVDLGPINVSAQSGYNSSMDLKFRFTQKSKLCGNSSLGLLDSSRLDARAP
jgi:hypothetical protein